MCWWLWRIICLQVRHYREILIGAVQWGRCLRQKVIQIHVAALLRRYYLNELQHRTFKKKKQTNGIRRLGHFVEHKTAIITMKCFLLIYEWFLFVVFVEQKKETILFVLCPVKLSDINHTTRCINRTSKADWKFFTVYFVCLVLVLKTPGYDSFFDILIVRPKNWMES